MSLPGEVQASVVAGLIAGQPLICNEHGKSNSLKVFDMQVFGSPTIFARAGVAGRLGPQSVDLTKVYDRRY
jgi:hypothetical protein